MCKLATMMDKARKLLGDDFETWYDPAYDAYHIFCDLGDHVLHAQSGSTRIHFEKMKHEDASAAKSRLVPDDFMLLADDIERWLMTGAKPRYDFEKNVRGEILFFHEGERRTAPRLLSRGYWMITESGMMKKCGKGTVFAVTPEGLEERW